MTNVIAKQSIDIWVVFLIMTYNRQIENEQSVQLLLLIGIHYSKNIFQILMLSDDISVY